ncbi:hypothetical protein [Pontibacter vulgaris]|uniref:hypothetical protein n=1 Tax=Pontibacter vulgaris TaxID=2905679 RepID=UPI001FA7A2A0|nr:hypothetical protein [Pontibacter vulgaris]
MEASFDETQERIFLQCRGAVNSEEFREGHLQALRFAKAHNLKQWLLDYRSIGELSEEEESWVQVQLFPQIMMSLGSDNYVAIVVAENCYQRMLNEAGSYGLQSYNSFVIFSTFCDIEEAKAWLKNHSVHH